MSKLHKQFMRNFDISSSDDKIGMNEPKGFNNNGNTCYFNSLLQCLVNSNLYNQSYFEVEDEGTTQSEIKNLIFEYVMGEDEINPKRLHKYLNKALRNKF